MMVRNKPTGPFHEGELAVQERAGVREWIEELGPRVIHDYMPEQHRAFFMQLPLVTAGAVDAHGQPWASVLTGPPGFIHSPDPFRLDIQACPPSFDPLGALLVEGASIGLLGIEPHTRRRNRMNGVIDARREAGFSVSVRQSFGNCPKYIQARRPQYLSEQAARETILHQSQQLDAAARELIRMADTFFIATAYPVASAGSPYGVDVSHRGGKPGFVRVDEDGTLTVPDFPGNQFFNTLGNISVNPRAGLLFMDFERGTVLYLAVSAHIIWESEEVSAYAGAERLMRFQPITARRVEHALPLCWGEVELSPMLEYTGTW